MTLFYGVSRYLFIDLALGVVISIFASYIFAMTVVPLYCAYFIRVDHNQVHGESVRRGFFAGVIQKFNAMFLKLLILYEEAVLKALERPWRTVGIIVAGLAVVFAGLFRFWVSHIFRVPTPGSSC